MTSVGLEPQWYITHLYHALDHLLVVGSLPQLIHLNLFSLACVLIFDTFQVTK
jgi:hypothetical protein